MKRITIASIIAAFIFVTAGSIYAFQKYNEHVFEQQQQQLHNTTLLAKVAADDAYANIEIAKKDIDASSAAWTDCIIRRCGDYNINAAEAKFHAANEKYQRIVAIAVRAGEAHIAAAKQEIALISSRAN